MDYAQATLPHDSTGLSPFHIEFGYEPRTSFDWKTPGKPTTPRERMNREDAIQFARRIYSVWKLARANIENAQQRQRRQADKHRQAADFEVGDTV